MKRYITIENIDSSLHAYVNVDEISSEEITADSWRFSEEDAGTDLVIGPVVIENLSKREVKAIRKALKGALEELKEKDSV